MINGDIKNSKMISRQRKWQLKKISEGLCSICSKKLIKQSTIFCNNHREKNRKRNRDNYWKKK